MTGLRPLLWLAAALLLALAAHLPVLDLALASDDFPWWAWARRAAAEPRLLLAPFGGWRPANAASLALDWRLFGPDPFAYHAASLAWHLACGALLWAALARFALSPAARAAAAAWWLSSPYTAEPVLSFANRHDQLLVASWLGLVAVWPSSRWSRGRAAAAVALALLGLLAKESWVVLPGFVLVHELALRRRPPRAAATAALLAAIPVAAYLALYLARPPIEPGGYYARDPGAAAKLPHAVAVLAGALPLDPGVNSLGVAEGVALALLAAAAAWAVRARRPLAAVGLALFVLPFLPVLLVTTLPTRYLAAPAAGFALVAADVLRALAARASASPAGAAAARAGVAALVLLALATNLVMLPREYEDARAYHAVYGRLVAEARAFLPRLPRDRPVLVPRLESIQPLERLAQGERGVRKVYFVRGRDPYGLTDAPSLFTWVGDPLGGPIWVETEPEAIAGAYGVVAHVPGGFEVVPAGWATAAEAARAFRDAGVRLRAMRPLGAAADAARPHGR